MINKKINNISQKISYPKNHWEKTLADIIGIKQNIL